MYSIIVQIWVWLDVFEFFETFLKFTKAMFLFDEKNAVKAVIL